MKDTSIHNLKSNIQFILSISSILLVSIICYVFLQFIGYKTVALILLMSVSALAMIFDILPVLLSAMLSAFIWNFFFIPPIYTFHIDNTEDLLMFLLYFIIASVNAVLTFKIRKEQKKVRDKEEREKTIKLYNTLLNSLSHELRTPIATIIGAIDTLKENQLSFENQIELLNQIDIASIRLNRQVENLLNMSRLESGILKLNLDWCDTNELISSVIQKFSSQNTHFINFVANNKLPLFKLDRGIFEQVLENIIHNAVNYTPHNSVINITANHIFNNCVIEICDNGNGILENEILNIFNKFYRIPNSKTGGSGLGLSIVKGFVEAHGGNITAENMNPSGLKFTIEMPLEASYLNNLKND